jgi:alkylation response protein AidB-like acyl-CoA dehydrogenase
MPKHSPLPGSATALPDSRALLAREGLTERQLQVTEQLRLLGEEHIGPAALKVDREGRYPHEAMDALKQAGLAALAVPEAAGGGGAGYGGDVVLLPLALMEIASWCSSTSQVFTLHNTGVQLVHALGDAAQRQYFFREATEGAVWFASFGSEAGANRFAMQSSLTKVDGGYRLNGEKIFATGSPGAKWAIWRAVPTAAAEKTAGESMLLPLVELSAPGITVIDDWDGIGQRGTGSGRVKAEQAFIPANHVIGKPGAYQSVEAFFNTQFHIHFAAQFVGIAAGALREAIAYIKEKSRPWTPGTATVDEASVQLRLGEMDVKLEAARQLVLRAARLLGAAQRQPELYAAAAIAASQAKVLATSASLELTSDLFQLMGARAATRSFGFDRYFRNARTLTLHDPVDKQRELLGRSLLKL